MVVEVGHHSQDEPTQESQPGQVICAFGFTRMSKLKGIVERGGKA